MGGGNYYEIECRPENQRLCKDIQNWFYQENFVFQDWGFHASWAYRSTSIGVKWNRWCKGSVGIEEKSIG